MQGENPVWSKQSFLHAKCFAFFSERKGAASAVRDAHAKFISRAIFYKIGTEVAFLSKKIMKTEKPDVNTSHHVTLAPKLCGCGQKQLSMHLSI